MANLMGCFYKVLLQICQFLSLSLPLSLQMSCRKLAVSLKFWCMLLQWLIAEERISHFKYCYTIICITVINKNAHVYSYPENLFITSIMQCMHEMGELRCHWCAESVHILKFYIFGAHECKPFMEVSEMNMENGNHFYHLLLFVMWLAVGLSVSLAVCRLGLSWWEEYLTVLLESLNYLQDAERYIKNVIKMWNALF